MTAIQVINVLALCVLASSLVLLRFSWSLYREWKQAAESERAKHERGRGDA